jgi:hypothetical protein
MRRRLQLVLCFSAAFSITQSQTLSTHSKLRFECERIGFTAGLPNKYVNCIAPDKVRFMRFGTPNGLFRHAGKSCKTPLSIPGDATSPAGGEILFLHSDSPRDPGRIGKLAVN